VDERAECIVICAGFGSQLNVTHKFSGALQKMRWVRQSCALKETHVHVRREYVDVAERDTTPARDGTSVVDKFPDFIAALSHHFEPLARDGSQLPRVPFHPRVDGGVPLDSSVEPQQFGLHRRSALPAQNLW
jgi:hypothetical protein